MTTFLFWLAIPLGFLPLPIGILDFVFLPFALVSLFNEFAAPRDVLLALFGLALLPVLPPLQRLCRRVWLILDPTEDNRRHAMLLGAEVLSSALAVYYITSHQLIGSAHSSWLITAYWFTCLVQLWSAAFLVLGSWIVRLGSVGTHLR